VGGGWVRGGRVATPSLPTPYPPLPTPTFYRETNQRAHQSVSTATGGHRLNVAEPKWTRSIHAERLGTQGLMGGAPLMFLTIGANFGPVFTEKYADEPSRGMVQRQKVWHPPYLSGIGLNDAVDPNACQIWPDLQPRGQAHNLEGFAGLFVGFCPQSGVESGLVGAQKQIGIAQVAGVFL
jgi:hypothetical protein